MSHFKFNIPTDDESPLEPEQNRSFPHEVSVTIKGNKEAKKQYKKLLALRNKAIKRAVKKKK